MHKIFGKIEETPIGIHTAEPMAMIENAYQIVNQGHPYLATKRLGLHSKPPFRIAPDLPDYISYSLRSRHWNPDVSRQIEAASVKNTHSHTNQNAEGPGLRQQGSRGSSHGDGAGLE